MSDGWTWPGTGGLGPSGPVPGQGGGPGQPVPGPAHGAPYPGPPVGPPPGPPAPPSPPSGGGPGGVGGADPGRDGAPPWVWTVAAVLFVALVAGVTWFLVAGRDDGQEVTVQLEPRAESGPDPFTSSFATVGEGVVRAFTTLGRSESADGDGRFALTQVSGDRSGLYGSVADGQVCDREGLADALTADADVAAAFADALGLAVDDVGPVVRGLAPVVLGRDTAVTNHRYRAGRAVPFQAVLQSGTAVLVDAVGVPRVRCACGNPLGPPRVEGRTVVIEGERWSGFSDQQVSLVAAAGAPVTTIDTVDVRTSEPRPVPVRDVMIEVPTGPDTSSTSTEPVEQVDPGGGELDGLLVADEAGVHVVSEDGAQRTTVIDHPVAAAFDDGAGGLIYQERRPGAGPDDLSRYERPPDDATGAAILHLPAGATEPVTLVDADGGSWPVLSSVLIDQGIRRVAYASLSGSAGSTSGDLLVRDLDGGVEDVLVEEAFLAEPPDGLLRITRSPTAGGGLIATPTHSTDHLLWMVTSTDLTGISTECAQAVGRECPYGGALDGDGRMISVSGPADGDPSIEVHDLVAGSLLLTIQPPTVLDSVSEQVDALGTRALVSHPDGSADSLLVDLDAGTATSTPVRGAVRFLRAPLERPTPSEGETSDPPTTDPSPPSTERDPSGCPAEQIVADLPDETGGEVEVNECVDVWAIVFPTGNCPEGPCADATFMVRFDGGRWVKYSGFPSSVCLDEAIADGVPEELRGNNRFRPC